MKSKSLIFQGLVCGGLCPLLDADGKSDFFNKRLGSVDVLFALPVCAVFGLKQGAKPAA